ncbi:CPBP family intramembrane metalloprotease [Aquihabitans sp. G128]|uniref:CPBP family intramembrane glutamic endopeptidase n=1 Tax=Aquihabitans sp. G128 TaxID=2849779 RepID=UPI001C22F01D|nr:CPBP family intramembrane glutamic endopeptidase [Aquihabitans sp. G128]QXC62809.1 CPBP family intramembrane metalloprotease [Aquihabitans sp. G128]
MTTLPLDTAEAPRARWGIADALIGLCVAIVVANYLAAACVAAAGYPVATDSADLPLWLNLVGSPLLWLGFVGVPVWAAHVKGNGVVTDFRLRLRATDLPLAGAIGVVTQLVLVPILSLPLIWATGADVDDLSRPARELADKVNGPFATIAFVLVIAIGAPIAEELFFRGLLLRSIQKRFGTAWAVAGSAVVFGLTHFEGVQTPALIGAGVVFGLVAVKTDRLGAAMVCHMAFNLTTVVNLLWIHG